MSDNVKMWRVDNDGYLLHDGDCHSWGGGVCTCGLIHHLTSKRNSELLMRDYWKDRSSHEAALHKLQMIEIYGEWPVSREAIDRTSRADFDDLI